MNATKSGETINQKIRYNAICAYLFMEVFFFFVKDKGNNPTAKNIDNPFVKSHSKSALLIHILLLLILFLNYNFKFSSTKIGEIIFISLLVGIFLLLLFGIYKANKGETFSIINTFKIKTTKNITKLVQDKEKEEKNKFELLVSYIPFISYCLYGQLRKNHIYKLVFKNNIKLNIIISVIITLVYISGHNNIGSLLFLAYFCVLAFIGVMLYTRDELIYFLVGPINKIKNLEIYLKSYFEYLLGYSKKEFKNFDKIFNKNNKNYITKELKNEKRLSSLPNLKITKYLIYIPFINLIYLFFLNSKYKFHIINGISITILAAIIMIFKAKYNIFLLYPICFGFGNLNYKLAYRQTFIFHIFEFILILFIKVKNIYNNYRKIKNTKVETSIKVNQSSKKEK